MNKEDGISAQRNEMKYACCPELYPDVTFTIHMRRGSLFYVINLIAPCFLIFLISFLGFFLPVESGEKVNLEITILLITMMAETGNTNGPEPAVYRYLSSSITILLALVVFLLRVGETMPPTPDSIPILGPLYTHISETSRPKFTRFFISLPGEVRSTILISVSVVNLSVSLFFFLFVCPITYLRNHTAELHTILRICVARSLSAGLAICYAFPVSWITSCLHIIAQRVYS